MTGNMKSNERIHYKIQVCLQNLALRKFKKSISENHVTSKETMNMQDQANSNLEPLNFESSSTEFSTSKERVDLLQDFQLQGLQHDIRSLSKESRQAVEKYIRIKENGHVTETLRDDRSLSRNVRHSLPILRIEPLEKASFVKLTYPKLVIKNNINVENNGDNNVTINEINREISKTKTPDTVFFRDNNKKDVQEKEIEDNMKLVLQDILKAKQTSSNNPIMVRKQLMDSRHYLEIGSQEKESTENKIRNSLRPCLKMMDKPTQSILKRVNERYSSFDDFTLDRKSCKACSWIRNQNCTAICLRSMAHIENNTQNKQIPVDRKRHFHRNRKYLTNKHDKYTSSYLGMHSNENIKDNSLYQCVRHYCGEDMINNLSWLQCYCKETLGSLRNEYRRHICKVRGNSSTSCGCKCKVTPSSQRVTFCLPSKKETT